MHNPREYTQEVVGEYESESGVEYEFLVTIEYVLEHYGADADGNRGEDRWEYGDYSVDISPHPAKEDYEEVQEAAERFLYDTLEDPPPYEPEDPPEREDW